MGVSIIGTVYRGGVSIKRDVFNCRFFRGCLFRWCILQWVYIIGVFLGCGSIGVFIKGFVCYMGI